jgi:hypothetical protein
MLEDITFSSCSKQINKVALLRTFFKHGQNFQLDFVQQHVIMSSGRSHPLVSVLLCEQMAVSMQTKE